MKTLQKISGFLPYIMIVFLNAFVDLGHKIVIQNTLFKAYSGDTLIILTAIINAFILLPFLLLFSSAGYLSDRFSKTRIMRLSAIAAIIITLLITFCYYQGWFWSAFLLTLLLATQSAIYSPAKYGYIRQLLGDELLANGNAVVQAITIVAILLSTFVFSFLFESYFAGAIINETILRNIAPLGWLLVAFSVCEYLLTLKLPKTKEGDLNARLEPKKLLTGKLLTRNLRLIRSHHVIWLSIIALSLFWGISQFVLATFPAYAKADLLIDNTIIIQGIMACTGIGIIIGSLIASKISKHYIEVGCIPLGALGVALGVLMVPLVSNIYILAFVFVMIGVAGALLIVPLNSLIQYHANLDKLGTILAGNNWMQNLSMLLFLVLAIVLVQTGVNAQSMLLLMGLVSIAGFAYALYKLPFSFARILFSLMVKRAYRFNVLGFDNLPHSGGVLLLGNHISWIDWLMVQIACPRPVRFVMLQRIYDTWYLKPIFRMLKVIPISSADSVGALSKIRQCLENGEVVCLFPEGAISRNGQLGNFRNGYERAVEGLQEGVIVPFYLHGLWGSRLSRANRDGQDSGLRQQGKRNVIVAFGPSLPLSTKTDVLKTKIYELSIDAWNLQSKRYKPIPLAWLETAKKQLFKTAVIDSALGRFSHLKMITSTLLFAKYIQKTDPDSQNIGILLPSSAPAIMTNLAVMLLGKTAVNINYSTSVSAVQKGLENAQVNTVVSSQKFIEKLNGRKIDAQAMLQDVDVFALETLRQEINKFEAILTMFKALLLPAAVIYKYFGKRVEINAPAQILFSSGSEGTPKGIVLSHANIQTNINQIIGLINPQKNDKVLSSLPIFHSFGLTVTSLMPMLQGIPAVTHPDPTDVLNLAKLVAKHNVTFMCATGTFLRLFVRNKRINAQMLSSLRLVIAGAEKLTDDVRNAFEMKFKKSIHEGYGATETTPVAAVNSEDKLFLDNFKLQQGSKPGTVGLPLPGTSIRIVDPDSLETLPTGEDGMILISGGQVMLGYLNDEAKTAEALIELDGRIWYKTGDKGHLDEDGFLTIVDRYSRFAKLGGEMVSLAAVERAIMEIVYDENADSQIQIAATAMSDEKKGEKVVVLMEESDEYDTATLKQLLLDKQIHPLMLPADIIEVDKIPVLGSGKKDFTGIKKLAHELLS